MIRWEDQAAIRERLAGEEGTIVKDWGGRLAVALVYPNTYHVGMSSLGLHALYRLFNQHDDVVGERAFLDGSDTPLALESQRPLTDFAAVAFTVSYELDYLNLVAMLRAAGIPTLAEQRDERHPIIIAGGPAPTANPLPLAPICDAVAVLDAIFHDDDGWVRYHYVLVDLAARHLGGEPVPADDVSAVRWVARYDLDQYPVTDGARAVIRKTMG